MTCVRICILMLACACAGTPGPGSQKWQCLDVRRNETGTVLTAVCPSDTMAIRTINDTTTIYCDCLTSHAAQ